MAFHKLALPERFEVVRRIGEGGMGVVYEAVDLERGEHVALKTILHHDTDTIARVKREFRALQDIVHPNLVTLRELVADSDDVFFTMELIEGVDLLSWVRGEVARRAPTSDPTAVDLRPSTLDSDTDLEVQVQPGPMPESASRPKPALPRAFDEVRLRDAFRQIALGLAALHGAGKVHRDVKPSNVRVAADGRVVLLDFGLVFEVDARHLTDANLVGTPAYMAPEQVSSKTVGPEADWYAVGVMLYECLCGRRPFEGASSHVLLAKTYQHVVAPSAFVADVPPDLEELCLALLQVEPSVRPGGGDVLRRLRARASDRPTSLAAPFVGRGSELAALAHALSDVSAGHPVVALLQGESGVGKSSLVRRFLDGIDPGRGNVMVLSGRCYERESVPYKALDEVVEALSRHLARMRKEESVEIVPPDLQSLAMVFPAMARVPALAGRASVPDRDPLERRKAAFRSLRALLKRLADTRRLVLAIDDLQWTDADSLALLHEILRGSDAPGLLLVATVRTGTGSAADLPALPGDVRVMQLGRLATDDARQLAGILLARSAHAAAVDADAIASEAAGHPLFIDELVRHASVARGAAGGGARLDEALWRRAQRLDPPARAVLDAACLLGVPAPQEVVAHAAGIELAELAGVVALLHATNFVRTHGARINDLIEPFHDRVREAIVTRLDEATRRSWHSRIAAALELAKGADPEVLATHWAGAGEPAKAAGYALIAAERAAQALAFDRAARLFEHALALLPRSDPRRRAVREQLGDALARAGHCARAAEAYERAAEGAGATEALDLRRRAADQLLRGAEIARGLEAARAVLEAVGVRTPRSTLGALFVLLWLRLLLLLRGMRYRPRDAQTVAREALTRVDVCWSVSFTLPYADALFAAISQARHVRLALAAGEPMRVARAVATEATYQSSTSFGAWPRAQRLLQIAHDAAERSGDPYARAVVLGFRGIAQCAAMRFEDAIVCCRDAVDRFRTQIPGSAFEITTVQFYLFISLAYAGRYDELRPMLELAVSDAVERGDKYAAIMLRLGILNSMWLFAGDPARARRELEDARRSLSTDRFRAVHYQLLVAECYVDIYEGLDEIAYQRLHDTLPSIRRALMLELQVYRSELAALRGRIAFALATRKRGAERERLVREGLATIKHVAVMPGPLGRVNERVMRVNAAALRGRSAEALAIVEAMAADDASDAYLSRQVARLVLAQLRGDPSIRALAERELAARGGAASRGLVRLYLPAYESVYESQAH